MRNIRLTLAYDGTGYVGWQIQPNGISVQGTVEAAIREFTGFETSLLAAGRTDAGVHALGQVTSFRTESAIPCRGFRAGLQTFLPRDILVRDADEAPLSFHATHAAKRKRYRYMIDNSRSAHPFLRNYAHEIPSPLDVPAMHAAAQVLVGKHDFRAFESHHPNTASSVRTIFEASVGRFAGWPAWNADAAWEHANSAPGQFVWIDVVADGFLYNMVRAITGTLIRVGHRKWDADDLRRILEGQDRRQAGNTAPACGLYLVSVDYGDPPQHTADESAPAAKEKDEARP
jgi:tRNA pseudouridine38-40 synthase